MKKTIQLTSLCEEKYLKDEELRKTLQGEEVGVLHGYNLLSRKRLSITTRNSDMLCKDGALTV